MVGRGVVAVHVLCMLQATFIFISREWCQPTSTYRVCLQACVRQQCFHLLQVLLTVADDVVNTRMCG